LIVRTLMLLAQNKDGSREWRGARWKGVRHDASRVSHVHPRRERPQGPHGNGTGVSSRSRLAATGRLLPHAKGAKRPKGDDRATIAQVMEPTLKRQRTSNLTSAS